MTACGMGRNIILKLVIEFKADVIKIRLALRKNMSIPEIFPIINKANSKTEKKAVAADTSLGFKVSKMAMSIMGVTVVFVL